VLKNYLKVAIRNIIRHKGYSIINIAGLAVGMACFIMISLWVLDEKSYDNFHENADDIYRVVEEQRVSADNTLRVSVTPGPLGQALIDDFPEIENFCRLKYFPINILFQINDNNYNENTVEFADQSVFDMFTFQFIKGEPETALTDKYSLVMTERMAKKYFGDDDPIGQIVIVNNDWNLKVTGIIEEVPHNSHLKFDFLIPFEILADVGLDLNQWGNNSFHTYVQLEENANYDAINTKITSYIKKHDPETYTYLSLQPLSKIHLHSDYIADVPGHGNITYVYIFSAIAIFVLIIACINYMNLATARASKRAREIGLRKVVGAERLQIVKQFLGESIIISLIALGLALILVELFLPTLNNIFSRSLSLNFGENTNLIFLLIGIVIITGIVAGSYPSLILSSFNPVKVLKSSSVMASSGAKLRKALVLIQFSLSIILIIGTIIVYEQIEYIRNKNLGFDTEHVVYMETSNDLRDKYQSFKNELLNHPDILNITYSSDLPMGMSTSTDGVNWDGKDTETEVSMYVTGVDFGYIKTFNMEIAQGRDFSEDFGTDSSSAYIVNEAAAKYISSSESPVGQRFALWQIEGTVIGVVKDYNFRSLHNQIEPMVLQIGIMRNSYISVKISSENIPTTIETLKKVCNKYAPENPFEYSFLDDTFADQYRNEMQIGSIVRYFTVMAIFIACLGLFGLSSFTAEQRTREIGVRKVLGASVANIILKFSLEFVKWVLLANIVAWPIAWYAMSKWLHGYAYRTQISWTVFVYSAIIGLGVVILTVSYQAIKAALANPVKSLRHE